METMPIATRLSLLVTPVVLFVSTVSAQNVDVLDIQADPNDARPLTSVMKLDANGGFVIHGFVRDVGNTTGCAPFIPATGSGTRFMWHPCRGALRFGRVPTGQANWDDANMDDFTFAGGNQVIASDYGAFAYGDQVTVSSTVGVGFGSGVTVSGTAGFSAGASNICAGFACTAIGYLSMATGQGSTALGYRTRALGDYTTALGHNAQTCDVNVVSASCSGTTYTGGFVFGDASSNNFVHPTSNNQFVARARGGVRFYTAGANDGNPSANNLATDPYVPTAGVTLSSGGSSWNAVSDRNRKEHFEAFDAEALLMRLSELPLTTWRYKAEADTTVRHIGPMAQDWQRLVAGPLGLNTDSLMINQGDFDGVNLAGVQALEARTRALKAENEALRAEVAALRAALQEQRAEHEATRSDLGARLARLEAALNLPAGAVPVPTADATPQP